MSSTKKWGENWKKDLAVVYSMYLPPEQKANQKEAKRKNDAKPERQAYMKAWQKKKAEKKAAERKAKEEAEKLQKAQAEEDPWKEQRKKWEKQKKMSEKRRKTLAKKKKKLT